MILDIALALVLLVAAGAYLLYVYRPAEGAAGRVAQLSAWLRSRREHWIAWRDRPRGPGPSDKLAPRPARPAPPRPAVPPPPGPGPGPAAAGTVLAPGEVPPAFAPGIVWLESFDPEADTDIMDLSRGLAAFTLAYARSVDAIMERCLTEIRLDPLSVAGMADHADEAAELAHSALGIERQLVTVYGEILAFRANGGVLPKDGDFLTAEGA
jgi:hypothetical protein